MIIVDARFLTQKMTGVQRYCVEVSLRLKKQLGERICFVSPSNIVLVDVAHELDNQIIGKFSGYYWEQVELPFFLYKTGSPLLLCMGNVAPILYMNKISVIHDVAFKVYPETFSKSFLYVYQILVPLILRTSKCVITVSDFSKNEIIKYYHINSNKVFCIYPGYKSEFLKEDKIVTDKSVFALAVSSLNYRKNFTGILKAFEIYSKSNKYCSLYVIGDVQASNFSDVDISKYFNNDRIHFLGRVSDEDLKMYYSKAKCFIFPSLYEGFGSPVLEAQACGCPVLTSNVSSLPEVVKDSAMICDPFSVNDISEKLSQMMSSKELREQYKKKGLLNIKRFNYNKTANALINLINKYDYKK